MRLLRRLRRADGKYFFDRKTTMILALLMLGGLIATKYGPAFVDNYELQKAMEETVNKVRSGSSDRKILESLMRRLKIAGLDGFAIEDFEFERAHGRMAISIDYEVFIDLVAGKGHTLSFSARAVGFGRK